MGKPLVKLDMSKLTLDLVAQLAAEVMAEASESKPPMETAGATAASCDVCARLFKTHHAMRCHRRQAHR